MTQLYITNLPVDTTIADARVLAERYGAVTDIGCRDGCVLVDFESPAAALFAAVQLDGVPCGSAIIRASILSSSTVDVESTAPPVVAPPADPAITALDELVRRGQIDQQASEGLKQVARLAGSTHQLPALTALYLHGLHNQQQLMQQTTPVPPSPSYCGNSAFSYYAVPVPPPASRNNNNEVGAVVESYRGSDANKMQVNRWTRIAASEAARLIALDEVTWGPIVAHVWNFDAQCPRVRNLGTRVPGVYCSFCRKVSSHYEEFCCASEGPYGGLATPGNRFFYALGRIIKFYSAEARYRSVR